MSKLWRCLEDVRGLVAVPAVWGARLDGEFGAVRSSFLVSRKQRARAVPCPRGCGCAHEVVKHDGGKLVGVCRCESWNCEDIELSDSDVVLLELNVSKLGREIVQALGCNAKTVTAVVPGVVQIGSFGAAGMPILFTIAQNEDALTAAVTDLVARLEGAFVLLVPTAQFVTARCNELLAKARAGIVVLDSCVGVDLNGRLRSHKTAGDLFSRFLPATGDAPDGSAVQVAMALLRKFDEQNKGREPSLITMFLLYCGQGLTQDEIAVRCKCAKGTVVNRLKEMEQVANVTKEQLRGQAAQVERVEDELSDSRARKIYRKGAIDETDNDD